MAKRLTVEDHLERAAAALIAHIAVQHSDPPYQRSQRCRTCLARETALRRALVPYGHPTP